MCDCHGIKYIECSNLKATLRLVCCNMLCVSANNKLKIFILDFVAKNIEKSFERIKQNTIFAIVKFQQQNLHRWQRLLMGVCAGSTQ